MTDDAVQLAVGQLIKEFSCAQSVFSAFAPRFGMSEELALKTAACFGAGISRQGQTCGAVTGALMALGLAFGSLEPGREPKELAYRKAQEFIRLFKERYGTTACRELVGYDLSDDAQLQAARDTGAFVKICLPLVTGAVGLVEDILADK